jgi:CRP-like cAMP-binding protein
VPRVDRIAAVSAFLGCETHLATVLEAQMSRVAYARSDVIAHQGDAADRCWLIIDGLVNVEFIGSDGQRSQLTFHGPGEVMGAYPAATTHRADLIVQRDVEALTIASRSLDRLATEHQQIGAGLARLFARQLDFALDRMTARSTLSAVGRVYAEILRLAGETRRIQPLPKVTSLAVAANTTRETASRAIAVLERRGIVERAGGALTIVSPRLLAELIA